jgi:hypothetical protein
MCDKALSFANLFNFGFVLVVAIVTPYLDVGVLFFSCGAFSIVVSIKVLRRYSVLYFHFLL